MFSLSWQNRNLYLELMRFDRPIGTCLVAWPALWALVLAAEGLPKLKLLLVFMLGAFLMRSAGCVINDYADRQIDGQVRRTKNRPLARNAVTTAETLQLFFVLCTLAATLLLLTNALTVLLAPVAIVLASVYPFMKRITQLPQLVLGMAFSWAVPMAFAAQTGHLPTYSWWLYLAVILWVVAYDTFYAMVDRKDDLQIGVKSTAILFGGQDRIITAGLQLGFLCIMYYLGRQAGLKEFYYAGLVSAGGLFIYQQWLIRTRDENNCFKAFLNNNYVGFSVFCGLLADFYL